MRIPLAILSILGLTLISCAQQDRKQVLVDELNRIVYKITEDKRNIFIIDLSGSVTYKDWKTECLTTFNIKDISKIEVVKSDIKNLVNLSFASPNEMIVTRCLIGSDDTSKEDSSTLSIHLMSNEEISQKITEDLREMQRLLRK